MTSTIRTADRHTVLVVDDHPLFRRGVRELLSLESSIEVVGEAGGRDDALELARKFEPDLIVLDLNIKGSSGVEILTALKDEDPSRRVVILTVSDAAADLSACIRAGADGYFLKDMEPELFQAHVGRRHHRRPVDGGDAHRNAPHEGAGRTGSGAHPLHGA